MELPLLSNREFRLYQPKLRLPIDLPHSITGFPAASIPTGRVALQ